MFNIVFLKLFSAVRLFLCLSIVWGCNDSFLSNYKNDPLGNFDYYFNELEEIYAYKDYRFTNLTLTDIKNLERLRLTSDVSWQNLVSSFERIMNDHIQDPHLYSLYSPVVHPNIDQDTNLKNARGVNFDTYLPRFPLSDNLSIFSNFNPTSGALMNYGVISNTNNAGTNNFGYIYVKFLTLAIGGTSRLTQEKGAFGKTMDEILNYFQTQKVESLIIDIRSDAGGAVNNGKEIAGRLVNTKKTFMVSYYRTDKNTYQRVEEYIEPQGVSYYQNKPVVILVNTTTCSGGEMLALMLRQSGNFKGMIGTPTRGCTGTIIDRELPNGWIMRITSSRTYMPDDTDYFKVGLTPDHIITAENNDRVLSNAVFQLSPTQ